MESGDEFLCYDADFSSVGKTGDHFAVDDLLDLPSDDAAADGGIVAAMNGASAESSPVTADSSSNSSSSVAVNATDSRFLPAADVGVPRYSAAGHFAGELCVPLEHYDELAQLEWMSNFADESFSKEDLLKIQLLQGIKPKPEPTETSPTLRPEPTGPTKARSKRPRLAGNWNSRLPTAAPPPSTAISSSSDTIKKAVKPAAHKKKDAHDGGDGRKCLHCSTDKTPQWRTGPMGPKTLCNACGVRFKSGRLVPEYRPASSPTFIMTKHSNSHRKVLELRRQKEMQKAPPQPVAPPYLHHHHHQNVMFDDDYLIHQHIGTDFR